jgi:vacuolar-type H+-ATPase subunit F/Vma7
MRGVDVSTATPISAIEEAFRTLTNRDDIGILLINQHVRLPA